ncbi:MAG: nucleotide sugar dehydrogenase [Clostridia bacterium]|nr:nucleotide sugar dehydrogenase [Clostridia bacterium]
MVTVFGLGFVGLTTALGFAHLGYEVFGVDVDENRKTLLKNGKLPFLEPHMEDILKTHINRDFFVADDVKEAIKKSEYVFYCVGTPYGENGAADLKYLFSAIDSTIDAADDDKFRVLVVKSTVPPSTTSEKVLPYVLSKKRISQKFGIANNPEFLREGHCWKDFIEADRIVIGCNDENSKDMLLNLYKPLGVPIIPVSHSTAEFIKYLSNTLLATLISYSNEMAQIADAIGGIDIAKAFRVLHMDKRWGDCGMRAYAYPGCGYGGYCLPKDTCALYSQSIQKGFTPQILKNVIETNANVAKTVAKKICKNISRDKTIGILGLSFKPESDDVRDTPAAKIIRELNALGYKNICAYDPVAMDEFKAKYADIDLEYCKDAKTVYDKSEVIAIVTAWEEFKAAAGFGEKIIVDCRYML